MPPLPPASFQIAYVTAPLSQVLIGTTHNGELKIKSAILVRNVTMSGSRSCSFSKTHQFASAQDRHPSTEVATQLPPPPLVKPPRPRPERERGLAEWKREIGLKSDDA